MAWAQGRRARACAGLMQAGAMERQPVLDSIVGARGFLGYIAGLLALDRTFADTTIMARFLEEGRHALASTEAVADVDLALNLLRGKPLPPPEGNEEDGSTDRSVRSLIGHNSAGMDLEPEAGGPLDHPRQENDRLQADDVIGERLVTLFLDGLENPDASVSRSVAALVKGMNAGGRALGVSFWAFSGNKRRSAIFHFSITDTTSLSEGPVANWISLITNSLPLVLMGREYVNRKQRRTTAERLALKRDYSLQEKWLASMGLGVSLQKEPGGSYTPVLTIYVLTQRYYTRLKEVIRKIEESVRNSIHDCLVEVGWHASVEPLLTSDMFDDKYFYRPHSRIRPGMTVRAVVDRGTRGPDGCVAVIARRSSLGVSSESQDQGGAKVPVTVTGPADAYEKLKVDNHVGPIIVVPAHVATDLGKFVRSKGPEKIGFRMLLEQSPNPILVARLATDAVSMPGARSTKSEDYALGLVEQGGEGSQPIEASNAVFPHVRANSKENCTLVIDRIAEELPNEGDVLVKVGGSGVSEATVRNVGAEIDMLVSDGKHSRVLRVSNAIALITDKPIGQRGDSGCPVLRLRSGTFEEGSTVHYDLVGMLVGASVRNEKPAPPAERLAVVQWLAPVFNRHGLDLWADGHHVTNEAE